MRILLVGASGTTGRAVAVELGSRHEIISAGRSSGDLQLDIEDEVSIRKAFADAGDVEAVVSTTGSVKFAPFAEMQSGDYTIGLRNKLMGQVNLVLIGREHLSDGGSFTLTTGVIEEALPVYAPYFRGFEPIPAARAALAYAKSVEGAQTGKVYRVS